MKDFKFGHRVEVRNLSNGQWQKARFVGKESRPGGAFNWWVLRDGIAGPDPYHQIRLDSEATEFLRGDEVEVRDCEKHPWIKAIYKNYDYVRYGHAVSIDGDVSTWEYCRYPKPEVSNTEPVIITIDGKDYEIREVER